MQKAYSAIPLLALALLLSSAACSPQKGPRLASAPNAPTTPAAGSPFTLVEKRASNLIIKLFCDPAPPIWGIGTLKAVVTDADGKFIDDAQVSFDLDMTNMRMGRNLVVGVSQGEGRYVGRVRFSMPGPWRVIIRIVRPRQAEEDQRFDFDVNFR